MSQREQKIFVVGDIHGMLHKFEKLLDRVPFCPERDKLILLGDYVDRGPDSRGVIQRLLDLEGQGVDLVCLRGNHEVMFEDYLKGTICGFFLLNGGECTLYSYRNGHRRKPFIPPEHKEFLRRLRPYYETETHIFVHAGLRPGVPLDRQSEEDLYWIRNDFILSDYPFEKTVVFGHTPFASPYRDSRKIGIDTGAVYGNKLTCLCLPDETFICV